MSRKTCIPSIHPMRLRHDIKPPTRIFVDFTSEEKYEEVIFFIEAKGDARDGNPVYELTEFYNDHHQSGIFPPAPPGMLLTDVT